MKKYISGSVKVLVAYFLSLVVFGVFLFTVLSLAKDNFSFWLSVYSFVIFLLMATMVYSDMKRLAIKEKRPQYDLNPYPVKGLIYGLLGIIPLAVLEAVYPLIHFADPVLERIKHLALNTLLGPVYGFIKLGNESAVAYIGAVLLIPIIAMLGYMAGFYGFELNRRNKKSSTPKEKVKK
jgi:hypothetical protein